MGGQTGPDGYDWLKSCGGEKQSGLFSLVDNRSGVRFGWPGIQRGSRDGCVEIKNQESTRNVKSAR
eukprot:14005-Eustigmatos_ZCMA.PRE.1